MIFKPGGNFVFGLGMFLFIDLLYNSFLKSNQFMIFKPRGRAGNVFLLIPFIFPSNKNMDFIIFKPGGSFVSKLGVFVPLSSFIFLLKIYRFHDFQAQGHFLVWVGNVLF